MPTLGAWKLRQPEFLFIVPATLLLFLISPLLAPGSVSLSTSLSVFSFASILAVAAIGQTLVIQQGGLDLTVPGVISLAAVLVTKYPDGENARLLPWTVMALGRRVSVGLRQRHGNHTVSHHPTRRDPRRQCALEWRRALHHQGDLDTSGALLA